MYYTVLIIGVIALIGFLMWWKKRSANS